MSLSKLWTGLELSHRRGNVEEAAWEPLSRIDPLQIRDARVRDWFPKLGLQGKYVGDGYPLCEDMPNQHYLRKGAKYRLLGGSKMPHWQTNDPTLDDSAVANMVDLTGTASSLYTTLCADVGGECTYPPIIELAENLPCDGSVAIDGGVDDFCNLSTLRTVKVDDVYYEYLRPPCVQFPFFGSAKMVWKEPQKLFEMCGNPRLPQALATCCGDPSVYCLRIWLYPRRDRWNILHHIRHRCHANSYQSSDPQRSGQSRRLGACHAVIYMLRRRRKPFNR